MPRATLATALAATGLAQSLATAGVFALPVLVAQAAPDFGLPAAAIGYQVGLVYAFAALASARCAGVIRRLGPLRATQAALGATALGVVLLASAEPWLALPASALIGTSYGLTNPAASQILARLAPAGRRNLVFAVKQMGVPLGVAAAGLLLPSLAEALGWRGALLGVSLCLGLAASSLQPWRAAYDGAAEAVPAQPSREVLRRAPGLRALALTGGAYALVQIALAAHMVAMLVLEFGWTPVAAGAMVGLCQGIGAIARIAWALLADAWGSGLGALTVIGLLSAVLLLGLPALHGAETWAVGLLFALLGATAAGWNGVLVAESVRLAPPGAAGAASGVVLSLTFAGAVLGPTGLALLATWLGDYRSAFALVAILPAAGAAIAWRARRSGPA